MVGDRDLLAFRRDYYDLFVSLLWKEPAGELLAALSNGIEARIAGARSLHPLLGEGWEEIGRFLAASPPGALAETVADEYTRLFLGPGNPEVNPYESYYLTGRVWDRPLAVIRTFLKEIGLEKQAGFAEPEDSLAFELEVMRRLIARQEAARDPDGEARWVNAQAVFLKEHLLVWGPAAATDLAEAGGAVFYRGVGKTLEAFLELERDFFKGWGPADIKTLEDARRGYGGSGEWKGPLFDPSGGSDDPPPDHQA